MIPAPDPPPNRASLLTPPGRGAVAVVAAEGPAALATVDDRFAAANRRKIAEQPVDRIVFGSWRHDAESREEVVVCRTGPTSIEVHCHGGLIAAERILAALCEGGCERCAWPDWIAAHAADALEAEADVSLAAATTQRTAAILLDQRHGALRRAVERVQIELAAGTPAASAAADAQLADLLERGAFGRRLTRPWQVAIAGLPNVGKSSLINALVGYERAIVFDRPGTTRDVLAADTAIDGWPVRLTDSAGLRDADNPLEAEGVQLAARQLEKADLVAWVFDATTLAAADLAAPQRVARRQLAAAIGEAARGEVLVVVNKTDLASVPSCGGAVNVSALTGAGLQTLLAAIALRLAPSPPEPGAAVPFTERQIAWLSAARQHLGEGQSSLASRALGQLLIGAGTPP
jgi:tRNA modification GTPase